MNLSRQDAIALGVKKYWTGAPCKRGHIGARNVGDKRCDICKAEDNKANSARISALSEKWRKSDRGAAWRADNKDRLRAYQSLHYYKNKGTGNLRHEYKRTQMPPWVDEAEVSPFYEAAKSLTKRTGIPHNVDHIIPLRGRAVSGLHVPANLQVIPEIQNQAKGNSFVDGSR